MQRRKKMTCREFLKELDNHFINPEVVEALDQNYGGVLSDEAARAFSFDLDGLFFDGDVFAHLLDSGTVLFAAELYTEEFEKQSLVPLIDICDGDFICFDMKDNCWKAYSVIDNVTFIQADTLREACSLCGIA